MCVCGLSYRLTRIADTRVQEIAGRVNAREGVHRVRVRFEIGRHRVVTAVHVLVVVRVQLLLLLLLLVVARLVGRLVVVGVRLRRRRLDTRDRGVAVGDNRVDRTDGRWWTAQGVT